MTSSVWRGSSEVLWLKCRSCGMQTLMLEIDPDVHGDHPAISTSLERPIDARNCQNLLE